MKIDVERLSGPGWLVMIRCTSNKDRVEWVAKPRIFLHGGPDGNYLEFEPSVRYRGIIVKRRPYREEELIAVGIGESLESPPVDLADYYRLPQAGSVRVRYVGRHPLAGLEQAGGPFSPVESDWTDLSVH